MNKYYKIFLKVFWFILIEFFVIFLAHALLNLIINKSYNFDQFSGFIRSVFNFGFGEVMSNNLQHGNSSVSNIFWSNSYISLLLIILSTLIGFMVSFLWVSLINLKFHKWFLTINKYFIGIFASIPIFILMPFLVFVFNKIDFNISFSDDSTLHFTNKLADFLKLFIIDFFISFSVSVFYMQSKIQKLFQENYYNFAVSIGYSNFTIFKNIIFKNLLIKVLRYIETLFLILLTNTLVMERLLLFNGISNLLNFAFINEELNLIIYFFVVISSSLLIVHLLIKYSINYISPMKNIKTKTKQIGCKRDKHERNN